MTEGPRGLCRGGVYYIRWYQGKKQVWKAVGTDPTDALKAQSAQERVLAGESVPSEERTPAHRPTLAEAVESFLEERETQTDARGLARWRWELELFARGLWEGTGSMKWTGRTSSS